ncbi:MAG: hypothetical protein MUC56_06145 [Thermoanaerobaculales bacterium]|jgi:hypothetical protein|nr:hypothetical protein [Thermoanaerobaculales bacterium]
MSLLTLAARSSSGCRGLLGPACLVACLALAGLAGADPLTLVVCAPGYPGSTGEAQPAMDGLASAAAVAAGWGRDDFRAVYFETEEGGVARLGEADAGLALVTLPFFLEHREQLGLEPELLAVPVGREPLEPWVLVAAAGKVSRPADLAGWSLVSLAGHSEPFVRGPALAGWGALPDGVAITFSGAVLSSLRRAARGEPVAVLLDGEQAAALPELPFASDLAVVHRSAPLPVSVLCSVDGRGDPTRRTAAVAALAALGGRPDAAGALAGVRIDRFEPVDRAALAAAEAAFAGAAD